MAGDGAEVRKVKGGEGGGDDDGEGGDDRERRDFGGTSRDGGGKLDNGRGPCPVSVPVMGYGGGSHMAGGVPDSQGEDGLLGH